MKELSDIGKQLRVGGKKSTRIPCLYPSRIKYAERILGVSSNDPLFKQKIEFNSYAICLNCPY